MKKLSYLLVLSGLISVPAIAADAPASPHTVTANVGVTTDYIFRGISQTQHKPALSGGVDYSHSSGLYAGTWLSNQGWVATGGTNALNDGGYKSNSSLEVDLYGGYKGNLADFGYDVGLITYYYPGDRSGAPAGYATPDTTEVYLAASWKMLTLKYSHAISDYFIGWGTDPTTKTKGSNYLELNASHDLGGGWGLTGHVGHQKIKNIGASDYTDWKLGVTKDVGFGTVTLAYSDTDADPVAGSYMWDGKDVSKGVFALSFAKTF
ncbi:MAG: TorF family putative porin [Pseudomonadota bacterium]|nr:TorF family putative porin [Pseudomonadota bacterium]